MEDVDATRAWTISTVAVCGAVLMSAEFAGARMLEAHWGSSIRAPANSALISTAPQTATVEIVHARVASTSSTVSRGRPVRYRATRPGAPPTRPSAIRPPAKATQASALVKAWAWPHHQCSVKAAPQFFSA